MGEQKISDGVMIGLVFAFIIFCFSTLIVSFDNSEGVGGVGSELSTINTNTSSDYKSLESDLKAAGDETGFVVKENIYIDERGQKEVDVSGEKSQTSIKNFITSLSKSDSTKKNNYLNVKVFGFIISFIILTFVFLGLRAILGGKNGRV